MDAKDDIYIHEYQISSHGDEWSSITAPSTNIATASITVSDAPINHVEAEAFSEQIIKPNDRLHRRKHDQDKQSDRERAMRRSDYKIKAPTRSLTFNHDTYILSSSPTHFQAKCRIDASKHSFEVHEKDQESIDTARLPVSLKSLFSCSKKLHFRITRYMRYYLVLIPLSILSDLFLPRNYPQSVHPGYMHYQIFDSLQGLCSYVRGTISTSAVLTMAGVGNAEATAYSAAMQWAMRDGIGMMGGLCFSYFASSYFDSHIKEFRLFADVVNDVGLFLDMLTPHIVQSRLNKNENTATTNDSSIFKDPNTQFLVLLLSSFATLCRVMCGMAAGATKGCITQHFSKHNMADLNAKENTQETLVSLLGMILGIGLARYFQRLEQTHSHDSVTFLSWVIFVLLTVLHLWANYIAVSRLRLRTLNQLRIEDAVQPFLHKYGQCIHEYVMQNGADHTMDEASIGKRIILYEDVRDLFLSPLEVNESFITQSLCALVPCRYSFRPYCDIRLGVPLKECFRSVSWDDAYRILHVVFRNENYILTCPLLDEASNNYSRRRPAIWHDNVIKVSFRVHASEEVVLKAFIHSLLIRKLMGHYGRRGISWKIFVCTYNTIHLLFRRKVISMDSFSQLGWEEKLYLLIEPYRIEWMSGQDRKEE